MSELEIGTEEIGTEEIGDDESPGETVDALEAEQVASEPVTVASGPAPGWEILSDEDDEEPVVQESPYDRPGRWFVVHTYAGYENKVKSNLQSRIVSMNMEDRIYEVVIPMEDVVEFKNGKKVVVQKKVFPGYLLTRCDLDDDSWSVIRNTPGVTGFVGPGTKPTPLSRKEVESILQVPVPGVGGVEQVKKSRPRLEYEEGETVRVKEGPFADFSGQIDEINEDQLKLKVLVNIFGRGDPGRAQNSAKSPSSRQKKPVAAGKKKKKKKKKNRPSVIQEDVPHRCPTRRKRSSPSSRSSCPPGGPRPPRPSGRRSGPTACRPWSSASSTTPPPRTSAAPWCRSRSASTRTGRSRSS